MNTHNCYSCKHHISSRDVFKDMMFCQLEDAYIKRPVENCRLWNIDLSGVEKKAANCINGYPYDDACDKCAREGLAGDEEHKHCFAPRPPKPEATVSQKETVRRIELMEE